MSSGTASASGNGGAPAGPQKQISIARAWWAGWMLLVTKLPRLLPLVLVPAVLAYLLDTSSWAAAIMRSNQILNIFGLQLLNVALYSLIGAGAYAVAFGQGDRSISGFRVGRRELSYLGAKLVFWTILFLMYVGASLIAQQVVNVLRSTDAVISTASAQASDAEWARQLTFLGRAALYGPLAISAAVFTWFGARFALVFPHAIATGRLRIFEAMALTKRRSWAIFALVRHVALQLILIYSLAAWYGGFGPYGLTNRSAPAQAPAASQYVVGKPAAPAVSRKALPKWVEPLSLVLIGTIWQIVFAGALTYAYKEVAPGGAGKAA